MKMGSYKLLEDGRMSVENKGRHKVTAVCNFCKKPIGPGQKYTTRTVSKYTIHRNKVYHPNQTYYYHAKDC